MHLFGGYLLILSLRSTEDAFVELLHDFEVHADGHVLLGLTGVNCNSTIL
jgi:hypothetical protein